MKETLKRLTEKDVRLWQVLLAGFVLAVIRLVLCSAQHVYLTPDEGLLDDMMMYNLATYISAGQWLGPYDWLTLSKHSFFALWLAGLSRLGIPYLLGGQLLWTAASATAAWAFMPLLRRRWAGFLLFGFLLFNPVAVANPAPFGYITRVYRDNIFPALCLICIAAVVGYALRHSAPLWQSIGWLGLSGLALGACWLTREDGWWPLPFLLVGLVVAGVLVARAPLPRKGLRLACLLLPFMILGLILAGWCGMNYRYYGRFIISDFSAHEFADAYGALVRVHPGVWEKKYAVPEAVRLELYEKSPTFAILQEYLERPNNKRRYKNYTSGSLYWAIRSGAASVGIYDSPAAAKAYFTQLAQEVNALCDSGQLPAGPKRSGVTPPLDKRYIPDVADEWLHSLLFCATFRDCNPRSFISPGNYPLQLRPMETFLNETVLLDFQENSDQPYYSRFDRLCYAAFDAIKWVYRLLTPLALLAAVFWQCREAGKLLGLLRKKEKAPFRFLTWLVMLGLLFLICLRTAMIAFVTISSFQIGTYIMYLASIHPLMILYGFMGVLLLLRLWWARQHNSVPSPTSS